MPNSIPNETAERIRNALSAGRKIEAVRLYREATGASLADAKAFIDQLEVGSVTMGDAAPVEKPAFSLTDHGWLVEQTDEGGVRLRRSALWRGAMVGCSFMVALFFSPMLIILWFLRDRIWDVGPPGGGVWQVLTMLIPLTFVGIVGLFFAAILWQILRLALWREEWEGFRNMLIVRRGLPGLLRSQELHGGELLLEPHFEGDNTMKWRLAVVCGGEKHYLLREPDIRVGGFHATHDKHAEASAIANLLAEHTGWSVSRSGIAIEGGWKPPSESNEDELLTALRSYRFVADFDEQLRLTISPPTIGRRSVGLVLLVIGVGWLWLSAGIVVSFVNDAQAKQQPVFVPFFWLLMIPFLMIGVGLCVLGIVAFFSRTRWTVDRNLLLVRGRIFGWKSEHEYVNARWKLAHLRRASTKGGSYSMWQLQLENDAGRVLKVLHGTSGDDDVPRLLGTLFSHRTGWPLCDT